MANNSDIARVINKFWAIGATIITVLSVSIAVLSSHNLLIDVIVIAMGLILTFLAFRQYLNNISAFEGHRHGRKITLVFVGFPVLFIIQGGILSFKDMQKPVSGYLNIEPASFFMDRNELEYNDCASSIKWGSSEDVNLSAGLKLKACQAKRLKQVWIGEWAKYNKFLNYGQNQLFGGMGSMGGSPEYEHDSRGNILIPTEPKPYIASDYCTFAKVSNLDLRPIFNVKAYVSVYDGKEITDAKFSITNVLEKHRGDVAGWQKVMNTRRIPTYSAVCISGNYENTSPRWQLYTGAPWEAQINENYFQGSPFFNIVFGRDNAPKPLFTAKSSGAGDISQCEKLVHDEVTEFVKTNKQ